MQEHVQEQRWGWPGCSEEQSWRQGPQPTRRMPTTQRNPTNLATNHDKHVIHLILLNDGFMWLVESHDLFRSADAIRWFIYELRKAYLDEHGCDFRAFFLRNNHVDCY
jgi:hypothetical protein